MYNFWTLVEFEYKKIFQKKTFWVAILTTVLVVIFTVMASISGGDFWYVGEGATSRFERMRMDRSVVLSKSGIITPELMGEALEKNHQMKANDDNYLINEYGKHLTVHAYAEYILPYEAIVNLLNVVYETDYTNLSTEELSLSSVNPIEAIDGLTREDVADFDQDLKQLMTGLIYQNRWLTDKEVEKNIALIEEISFPLNYEYYGGYEAYVKNSFMLGLTVLFVILLVLTPLFANEYEERTSDLILASKNGKGSLCGAKLFVASTFAFMLSIAVMGSAWLGFLGLYGFEGANMQMQVLDPTCTYSITLGQACTIYFISVVVASVLFANMIVFFSAKVKRVSFYVVVVGTAIIMVPLLVRGLINPSTRWAYDILLFFPTNIIIFDFGNYFFEVFGMLFTPYKFIWSVSSILIIFFAYMAIHAFRNHQTN